MSSLYASRWAATPPPELSASASQEPNTSKDASNDKSNVQEEEPDMHSSEGAAEKALPELPQAEEATGGEEEAPEVVGEDSECPEQSSKELGVVNEPIKDQSSEVEAKDPVQMPDISRLEAPRLKKRVSWRGRTILISISNVDFPSLGKPMPMNWDEVQHRMKSFEDEGYDIRGFSLSNDNDSSDNVVYAHAKPIWPDEAEMYFNARQERPKVTLPDLKKMKDDENRRIEEKLAALGVLSGGDEPPLPPAPPAMAQDISRQSSGQYPPLPFSPPIPTGSGGSMGRPPIMRGHSHTMSVASPLSPGAGPFGHMHRHSTFSGTMGFPQLQMQPPPPQHVQQPGMAGMQPFSPQKQFTMPGFPRGGSPAQVNALRQEVGPMRGPGSPLSQQMFGMPSPQDYSRGLMEDQRRRQHGYSQSVQHQPMQQPMQHVFTPQMQQVQQTPVLPELLEEDDEEELLEAPEPPLPAPGPEPPAYVPPHKRAQINADVAVPTPTRGHRHNISEGLERDILEAEQRHEAEKRNWIEVTTDENWRGPKPADKPARPQPVPVVEKDPLGEDLPVQEGSRSHKKSASRFNVGAPSFSFNPTATFHPGNTAFTFGMPPPQAAEPKTNGHTRNVSSGTFNAAAPSFRPGQPLSVPKTDFSFSTQGPTFKPDAPAFQPPDSTPKERNIVDELPSIFGKVNIPDIVKPARRSKAVAIVPPKPSATQGLSSSEEFEEEEGHITIGDDRIKRSRRGGDDGDQVPQFAEPTAMPDPVDFAVKAPEPEHDPDVGEVEAEAQKALDEIAEKGAETVAAAIEEAHPHAHDLVEAAEPAEPARRAHGHKPSSSLSALAKPFEPPMLQSSVSDGPRKDAHERYISISELEDGEIQDDETPAISPVHNRDPSAGYFPAVPNPQMPFESASGRIDHVAHAEPSFDEIDAVMRQLNDANAGAEDERPKKRAISPLPTFDEQPMDGVTYLPDISRSGAPSPSPRRRDAQRHLPADSSFTAHERTDSGEPQMNGWSQIRRLNKADDHPPSDWDDMLSPPEVDKLNQRTAFFDSHIDDLIGRIVERRLQPLEDSLARIHSSVSKRTQSSDRPSLHRGSSNIDSDADDEDDFSDEQRNRPISRGRDKRVDQIKAAVMEALREQSPRRSQSSYDIADLHSALADMKVSFARAASASLELEDIRAVVEDVLHRQGQALVHTAEEQSKGTHKREMSELEGRLNETLAGALEEANHRRAVEEREAETRRLLRLAEEELHLLRDGARDDDGRYSAMEEERRELIERAERAEEARAAAEDRASGFEAENEAMQATLEEYRTSSTRWRQEIDNGKQEREDLENTIAALESQVEEGQESSNGMKRRLEKLHSDMATAAGQLADEKAKWIAREEDYRIRCEALETQTAAQARERHELEEEVRVLRAGHSELNDAKLALDHTRASNASLDELVRKLQADLVDQQSLAARFERDYHEARESGRAEVHRTRISLETDIEAANHQVNIVRAELESELLKVRTEQENTKMEAETAKARYERLLEEEDAARREALRKVNHASSVALDEARQRHEVAVHDLAHQHQRALQHAMEDKERSEYILNERLSLSDAKLQHYQDRILHLEERVEVAKSAAQAAAMSAQSRTLPAAVARQSDVPEKINPQVLRESILVLQQQLQAREETIENLQNQLENEGPAKLKERDSEIAWLRELLSVRGDDLTDLVNTLSKPIFDRDAVRDSAIRLRASLQMEQQEKERLAPGPQLLGGQALASISNFATPSAKQLFNKWRSSMESSALRVPPPPKAPVRVRSNTPSKPSSSSGIPPSYMAGLMTPPASNLRNTPSPETTTSLPPPRLQSRSFPADAGHQGLAVGRPSSERKVSSASSFFGEQSYDQDAEDSKVHMQSFDEDDDLDIDDNQPPAFRSLEAELEPSAIEDDQAA